MNPLSKTPFLSLLIPLIVGILLQYYLGLEKWAIPIFLIGVAFVAYSYLTPKRFQYELRWIFGAGAGLILIASTISITSYRQHQSEFIFPREAETYRAILLDIPENKPKTRACKVYLPNWDKQIICYIKDDTLVSKLRPGDEFIFRGTIQAFQNNPENEFDYISYMHNNGFAGSIYLSSQSWQATGNAELSLKARALRCREHILHFYESIGLEYKEYSLLSALTLGYRNALSEDMKAVFYTTGTVHILSVSGLHVGIIYLVISLLLSFIPRNSKYYILKPLLIMLLLWVYAFVVGLPISVVRAGIMLSVFCVSDIIKRKSFSIHGLFISAFLILAYNPLSLFDVGFQLSFISVFFIIMLQPRLANTLHFKNKLLRSVWNLSALSIVAQLGTFPLVMYYFGTFPTYFLISNLLIVPFVSLITYTGMTIGLAQGLTLLVPSASEYFYYIPVNLLKILIGLLSGIGLFLSKLPFALIDNIRISVVELYLFYTFIISAVCYMTTKKENWIKLTLFSIVAFIIARLFF